MVGRRARLFLRTLVHGAPQAPQAPPPSRSDPPRSAPTSATAVKRVESPVPPPGAAPGPELAGDVWLPPVVSVSGRRYILVDQHVKWFGPGDVVTFGSYRSAETLVPASGANP